MCSVVSTKPLGILSKSSTPCCNRKQKNIYSKENTLYFLSFLQSCSNVKCECVHHHKTYAECVDSGWSDSKLGLGREGDVSRWRWKEGGWKNEHRHVKYCHPEVSSYHQVSLWESGGAVKLRFSVKCFWDPYKSYGGAWAACHTHNELWRSNYRWAVSLGRKWCYH